MNRSFRTMFTALFLLTFAFGQVATAHDAVQPTPRAGKGWMDRHNAMNERVKQGNVDLLLIGDSITHGWEGKGAAVWAEYYTKRNAVNLGIGGDRTQHVLWRLQNGNIENISPKAAVIMIGTNNAAANTPNETAEGITAIVKQLRKDLPETKILLLAIFPRGQSANELREKNTQVNSLVSNLHDGEHIHFLDIGANLMNPDGTIYPQIMPDFLHLSEAKLTELMCE